MMSKAIDELNNFLFFSPKVVLLSSNVLLDRMTEQDPKGSIMSLMIANWDQQEGFFKRYRLFKKADCLEYLNKIWEFSDLERREGKLGLMFDIIKGIIRISKIAEITSSIEIYGPKQISNIFLLLKCFKVKEEAEAELKPGSSTERWFMDRCNDNKQDREFISAVLDIVGVLLRKAIIIHKIYQEFNQKEFQLHSGLIYRHVLAEMRKLVELLYFPESRAADTAMEENSEDQLNEQIRAKLTNPLNYINYGHSNDAINRSLKIIEKNIIEIEEREFGHGGMAEGVRGKGEEMLRGYEAKFYASFHRDFMAALEEIYCRESHSFIVESFETIMSYKPFKSDEVKFMKGYRSDDRKAVKEYVFILSFMKALEEYFEANHLSQAVLYRYLLMCLLFFYLKLNYHVVTNLIQPGELLVIEEQRKADKKLRKKEEEIKRVFYKLLTEVPIRDDRADRLGKADKKVSSGIGVSFHTTDKLKILQRQNQMLLGFSFQFFGFVEEEKNGSSVEDFVRLINKLEPANYDEQIGAKLLRVEETLPDSEKALKQFIVAVFYKLVQMQCIITAKIYRETGAL